MSTDVDHAHMNGDSEPHSRFIDTIDPDDPEYVREMQRPNEIKEDMRQMESRKRVSVTLKSPMFREEVEQIIADQLSGAGSNGFMNALQNISDMFLPRSRLNGQNPLAAFSGRVLPIADIKGQDAMQYGKGEKPMRCKAATAFRLLELSGYTHGISDVMTYRMSQEFEHFLVNPYGMLPQEVTAASLVRVDMQGRIMDSGMSTLGINKPTFLLHAAVHAARPDLKVIINLANPQAVAVTCMTGGLLPITREAAVVGPASWCDYPASRELDAAAVDQLAKDLGPNNKVLLIRSFGILACGETVEEAYFVAKNVMTAASTQMQLLSCGRDQVTEIPEEVRARIREASLEPTATPKEGGGERKWKIGELEFEAIMRQMDGLGYRTGYIYREPLIRREPKRGMQSDIEIPPSAISSAFHWDAENDQTKYTPLKMAKERQKKTLQTDWINSPQQYIREEFEETGTDDPKAYGKWVPDRDGHGVTSRTATHNQFAPLGNDPKELKNKQKQIRAGYYQDKISSGPSSKILEGISWDEAQKPPGAQGDSVIVMGAASKGIIQRDHQHNAQMYRANYSVNPFGQMTEKDLLDYQNQVSGGPGAKSDTEAAGSPTKSTSSMDGGSSKEGSPVKELRPSSPGKEDKKKKKKFRMPSFTGKKKA